MATSLEQTQQSANEATLKIYLSGFSESEKKKIKDSSKELDLRIEDHLTFSVSAILCKSLFSFKYEVNFC